MSESHKKSFSVAICVYGGDNPSFFKTAMESIFNQSRQPNEVVLTIDGPVKESINKIVDEFKLKYSFLKIVRLEKCMGHGIARKECINNCSNEIIAIADADDINMSNRFEIQMSCFENNHHINVVGSSHSKFIDTPNNVVAISVRPKNHFEIVKLLKRKCPITQACAMFTREIYDKAGGYLDWYCAEDYYLWIRMYESGGQFYNCPEVLVNVRTSKEQYKRRGGWKYFKSTSGISKYMLDKKIITPLQHICNVVPRFVIQVLMPSGLRGRFRNIAIRKSSNKIKKLDL